MEVQGDQISVNILWEKLYKDANDWRKVSWQSTEMKYKNKIKCTYRKQNIFCITELLAQDSYII